MTTTAVPTKKASTPLHFPGAKPAKQRKISWPDFQKRCLDREDGLEYEWVNGEVAKSKHLDFTQFFVVQNLRDLFETLRHLGRISGILMPEGDIHFAGNHRRPDLAFFTPTQIGHTAYGKNQVPQFVIEVISTKDQMNLVHEKMQDYRASGVSVVWHVFPKIEEVHVYFGPGLKKMTVCTGEDICSAAPVLPDFELSADAVFQKPPRPEDLPDA